MSLNPLGSPGLFSKFPSVQGDEEARGNGDVDGIVQILPILGFCGFIFQPK